MKTTLKRLLLALGLTAFCAATFAVFDPVNDDTDLFRNNPNIPAERPNVLILLDNTANWSSGTKFSSEKTALVNTVAALDSSFNVGLMIFTQGGNCATGSTNGGYVRYGIRQLTTANKAALTDVVTNFTDASCGGGPPAGGDQGSGAAAGQALHEAYLYFSGLTSRTGILQVKRDYFGSTVSTAAPTAALTPNPFTSAAATVYTSPITDACAKNYIIFISNGPFDNGDDSPSSQLFANATTGLVPNASGGTYSSWADEYADYLANTGVTVGTQNSKVFMYAVEVDPVLTGQGPDHTNLLKSMATRGKGKYFGLTSANAGVAITEALLAIFTEIQAVNSVFAASTLPVSVNVRGTNLNQLYIGVFRPDATDQPRWLGNLKAYQLKRDAVTNTVFTVDANLNPAINSSTGFITSNAKSFWTSATVPTATYWGFRSAAENGVGGSSDSPDGDLVEKGGAAQQLRARYFAAGVNASSPSPSRQLYTCTQGATVCKVNDPANPSLLSATPFSVANTAIDAAALNLDARNVSPLSAKVTKPISALRDAREVSITNAGSSAPVTALTTNSITGTVTLNNSSTANISAMSNNANTQVGVSCQSTGTNGTARVVTTTPHGLAGGTSINVAVPGDTGSKYNVTSKTISYENTTSFTYTASGLNASAGTLTCDVTSSNTSVLVTTSAAHGFTVGQNVTIAGASPTAFNGLKAITAVGSPTSFTFAHTVGSSPTISSATAVGASSMVKVTKTSGTFAAGTFGAGQQVTISGETSGSTPSYNNTYTILTTTSSPAAPAAPTTTVFYISTGTTNTTAATGTITAGQSGLTATAVLAGHTFIAGNVVAINGASPNGFNGSKTITSVVPGVSFSYDVTAGLGNATPNPAITVSQSTIATVTATLANHKYVVGDFVTIAGVTGDTAHNASWQVATVPDASTFTYSTVAALGGPGGTPTVRLTTNPRAYATITGHGYGADNSTFSNLNITGATPAGYNVVNATGTVEDANTISYVLTGALGTNTGLTVNAVTPGLTAKATSTAHGFSGTPTVTIAGASPSAFNGAFTIAVTGNDTFEYTLATAQNDASGTITATASGGSSSERDNVINWIRGEDNFQDENSNSSFSDTRASMHGDVLHSRPSVVNYNRRSTDTANIDNDVYIFYGGNDGVFRAVKGGFGSSTTTTFPALAANDPLPGEEVWGFVARDHFANLRRLRTNSPGISNAFKKPYFFDGPIGAYTKDANGDGMLDPSKARAANGTITSASTGDKVWLFLTMRRGGRAIYALDVGDPVAPKMLWRKGCPSYSTDAAEIDALTGCDLGFSELGQTWSEPKVVQVVCSTTPCPASGEPALMFGAGYDATVEDLDPATITSSTATAVVSSGTTYNRSMGRGIFVMNAATGALIFHASPKAAASVSMPTGAVYKQVTGMDYPIPSDLAVVVGDPTPKPFRAYVGDTGGQMWRFDFGNVNPASWTLKKLASIADHTTTAVVGGATVIPGMRKFQFPPDVIGSTGFDMVIAGTGDREHPFDSIVVNRVYAFKDKSQTADPAVLNQASIVHATTATYNSITVKALQDVTTQCIEIPANCTTNTTLNGGAEQAADVAGPGTTASQSTSAVLSASTNVGWFITLAAGEKQVGSTLASGSGVVQFGTNQPSASAGGGACSPNLGVARQYAVNYLDGTAFNGTALSTLYVGGGFLPSPVLVFVGLGGATGTGTTSTTGVGVGGNISSGSSQLGIGAGSSTGGTGNVASAVVCYGASCSLAPGSVLFSRLRKFWYKEID